MAEVIVPIRHATDVGFPAVCAMTGERADGAVSIRIGRSWKRWTSPSLRIPLSEPVFEKWTTRQNIHIKARAVAAILTSVGVVLAFRNGPLALGVLAVAIAVHLVDLWAERTAAGYQPAIERRGNDVALLGVHERFAEVVHETILD